MVYTGYISNLLFTALALLCVIANGSEITEKLPEETKMSSRCNVNVCFAIDGSDNLDPWQFRVQRAFVAAVVSYLDESSINVAAVQYGISNRVISSLTSDIADFLEALREARFVDSSASFVGAGVVYCQAQLRRNGKIVLLGTGQSDLGGDPAVRADAFRKAGGEVLAVGIGDTDVAALNDIAGGKDNVFYLRRRAEIADLLEDFIGALCN